MLLVAVCLQIIVKVGGCLYSYTLQVFDLNNWENSRWAYFPGISGWVGSKHFGDTAQFVEDGQGVILPKHRPENYDPVKMAACIEMHA